MTITEKAIEEIMQTFDFHRVKTAMDALNWMWAFPSGLRVPTLAEIKDRARVNLEEFVVHNRTNYTSRGGFVIQRQGSMIHLSFEIEEATSHTE